MRQILHDTGMLTVGCMIVAAAETGTVLLAGFAHQLDRSRAEVSALRHRPTLVTVTVTPTPGTAGHAPSPQPAMPGSLTVVAAGRPNGGSGGSGGGVAPQPRPGRPGQPSSVPSSPSQPSPPPPRQGDCSTIRVTAQTPLVGVLACGTLRTTRSTP